jgi:hypothetical protein
MIGRAAVRSATTNFPSAGPPKAASFTAPIAAASCAASARINMREW